MEWVVFFSLVFLAFITFVIIVVKEFRQINFVRRYNSKTLTRNDPDYPRPRFPNRIGSN